MPADALKPAPASSIKGAGFAHVDFVFTGVVMTMLGPLLPVFSRQWSLNDTQAGYLFVAQWVCATAGMYFSAILQQRYGYRKTLMAGLVLMVAGLLGLGQSHWILGIIFVGIYGAGTGVNTPAANLMTAEINPGRSAAALNLLNSSWGIGAMVCPFVIAAAVRSHRTPFFLYGMAAALIALTICMSFVRFNADSAQSQTSRLSDSRASIWTFQLALVAALFFTYVGTETAVGGWIASYARRIDPEAKSLWAIMPSFFWGALLVGRALAPVALRYARATSVAKAGVTIAAFGVGLLLAAKSITLVMIGAGVAGLGLASIFPINVSLLPHWFGSNTRRSSGVIFSLSNFGGAAFGWLVGALSSHFGSLRVGFLVPLAGALGMLAFYLPQKSSPDGTSESAEV
jgi:FHS family glucose/mannose:H+ symporter-like MFS transporter